MNINIPTHYNVDVSFLNRDLYLNPVSLDDCKNIDSEIQKTAETRKRTIQENYQKRLKDTGALVESLLELGVPRASIIKKESTNGFMGEAILHSKYMSIIDMLNPQYDRYTDAQWGKPTPPIKVKLNGKEYSLPIRNTFEKMYEELHTIIGQVRSLDRSDDKVKKAIQYLLDRDIKMPQTATGKDIIDTAEEVGRQEYIDKETGSTIDVTHSSGDNCKWTVGDHRCECGTNRYNLEVEGNFLKGYYGYGVWC